MNIQSTLGDLSQFMYFFAALYVGTPLIAGYGETAFNDLQRRRANCFDALENDSDDSLELSSLDTALEDLRMALDSPSVKPSLTVLLAFALAHGGLAIVFGATATMPVPALPALTFMLTVSGIYAAVAFRGVGRVLSAERDAAQAAKRLETSLW